MKYPILSSLTLLLALWSSTASAAYPFSQFAQRYEEQSPVEAAAVPEPSNYAFSYNTGSGSSQDASHFREESRDASGLVVGKYGYVDPYGKLRVVSYTAGPQGFVATGDIGPDQEVLRQQRELYAADPSYQIQQQVWQQLATGQQQQTAQQYYSNNAASAAAAAAASAASSGSEWTSVNQGASGAYTSGVKGQQNRFAERYTAAGGIKSPLAAYREQQTTVVQQVPVVQQTTSVKSIKQSSASGSSSAAASAAAASSAYTAPAVSQTFYSTKTAQVPVVQTAAIKQQYFYQQPSAKLVQSTKSNYVQQQQYTSGFQSPAARLTALNQGSSSSSSAASASASSGAYTSGGVKGYSGAIKSAPLKVARYTDSVPSGRGHTVVNFQQGGPVPYKYSYSFK